MIHYVYRGIIYYTRETYKHEAALYILYYTIEYCEKRKVPNVTCYFCITASSVTNCITPHTKNWIRWFMNSKTTNLFIYYYYFFGNFPNHVYITRYIIFERTTCAFEVSFSNNLWIRNDNQTCENFSWTFLVGYSFTELWLVRKSRKNANKNKKIYVFLRNELVQSLRL